MRESGTSGDKYVREVNANYVSRGSKELSLQASTSNAARYCVLKILNTSRQPLEIGKNVKLWTAEAILQRAPRVTGFDSQHLEAGETSECRVNLVRRNNYSELAEVRAKLERRFAHLAPEERQILMPVMNEYLDLFCNDKEGVLLCTTKAFHEIRTGDALPVKKIPYRVSYALREEMKKCFRQTALRPSTEQRSTSSRAEDKLETSETYGTRYTRLDSQTPHSDVTEKDMIENLPQDPDCEPYHPSHTRASSCGDAEVREGGSASPKYPMGNQAGEHHQDVCDRPNVSEGEGGSTLETLCTELVNPEPLEVESVTNTGEKVESTPRYNLRPCSGRNV